MPAPYNYDLRRKAIEAVKQGEREITVCRMLNISRKPLRPVVKTGGTSRRLPSDYRLSAGESS